MTGVGNILTGLANPSGRLVDTYAYDTTTNPTYYNTDDNRYANADGQTFYQYEEGMHTAQDRLDRLDQLIYLMKKKSDGGEI